MKTISTAADIATLSEEDKDLVFSFDTARERFKGGLIRAVVIPLLMVVASMFSIYSTGSIETLEWVRPATEWLGYIGIGIGLLGVSIFSRNLKEDYRAMQATKLMMVARGLDASRMRSDDVWAGLFTQQKAG